MPLLKKEGKESSMLLFAAFFTIKKQHAGWAQPLY
jgi:hypothetical protein